MEYQHIKVSRDGAVAVISFNRPAVRNAIGSLTLEEFTRAANELNADDSVRVVVLTGEGRGFCAGADLTEDLGPDFSVEKQLNEEYKPALMAITEAPKPWISAVNGAAAGVGSAFAMNCDLTVMADDAYIYQAFVAIGLIPDGGATWHLARTIGRKRAYELMVSGDKLPAEKCLALGLCNRVVAAERLLTETLAWAAELADKAPLSLRYTKASLNAAMENDLGDTISHEARLQDKCITSEDAQEGIGAFIAKRKPVFKGR